MSKNELSFSHDLKNAEVFYYSQSMIEFQFVVSANLNWNPGTRISEIVTYIFVSKTRKKLCTISIELYLENCFRNEWMKNSYK